VQVPDDLEGDSLTARATFVTGPLAGTLTASKTLALKH
jgi:hypothetical protein